MKDVGGCDKPGGDADQSMMPGMSEWGNLRAVMRDVARPEYIGRS